MAFIANIALVCAAFHHATALVTNMQPLLFYVPPLLATVCLCALTFCLSIVYVPKRSPWSSWPARYVVSVVRLCTFACSIQQEVKQHDAVHELKCCTLTLPQ
jgi:4-hydroxybenzoate polyprenyltransferase